LAQFRRCGVRQFVVAACAKPGYACFQHREKQAGAHRVAVYANRLLEPRLARAAAASPSTDTEETEIETPTDNPAQPTSNSDPPPLGPPSALADQVAGDVALVARRRRRARRSAAFHAGGICRPAGGRDELRRRLSMTALARRVPVEHELTFLHRTARAVTATPERRGVVLRTNAVIRSRAPSPPATSLH